MAHTLLCLHRSALNLAAWCSFSQAHAEALFFLPHMQVLGQYFHHRHQFDIAFIFHYILESKDNFCLRVTFISYHIVYVQVQILYINRIDVEFV